MDSRRLQFLRKAIAQKVTPLISAAIGLSSLMRPLPTFAYVVQRGDTLSTIAQQHLGAPVYGKTGNLRRVIQANPEIKNPDLIQVGQFIALEGEREKPPLAEPLLLHPALQSAFQKRAPASDPEVISLTQVPPLASSAPSTEAAPLASKTDDGTYSLIELSPRFSFIKVSAVERDNGSSAELLSNLNYGFDFKLVQVWSESFQTFVGVGIDEINLTDAAGRTMTGASQTYGSFNVGIRVEPSLWTTWNLKAGASEQVFYHSISETAVTIDNIFVPRVDLSLDQDLFKKGKLSWGLEGTLSALGPGSASSYSVDLGYGYQGEIYFKQSDPQGSFQLQSALYYGQVYQNTSILTTTRTDLGVVFDLGWSFGK